MKQDILKQFFKTKSSIFCLFCSKKCAKVQSHIAPLNMSRTHTHPAHFSEWILHAHTHTCDCKSHVCVRARTFATHTLVKFIYSEKATKVCEIFTLLLSYVVPVKSKVKTLLNCVVFSEYMNFNLKIENNRTCFFFQFHRCCQRHGQDEDFFQPERFDQRGRRHRRSRQHDRSPESLQQHLQSTRPRAAPSRQGSSKVSWAGFNDLDDVLVGGSGLGNIGGGGTTTTSSFCRDHGLEQAFKISVKHVSCFIVSNSRL